MKIGASLMSKTLVLLFDIVAFIFGCLTAHFHLTIILHELINIIEVLPYTHSAYGSVCLFV